MIEPSLHMSTVAYTPATTSNPGSCTTGLQDNHDACFIIIFFILKNAAYHAGNPVQVWMIVMMVVPWVLLLMVVFVLCCLIIAIRGTFTKIIPFI